MIKSREEINNTLQHILRSDEEYMNDNRASMVLGLVLATLLDIRDQNDELIRIAEETYMEL